jgi:hypothetical protein
MELGLHGTGTMAELILSKTQPVTHKQTNKQIKK